MDRARFTRRTLLSAMVLPVAAICAAAYGQRPPRRLAVALGTVAADSEPVRSLRLALQELGYQEGRDLLVEVRSAGAAYQRIPAMVDEMIATRPDVIVVENTLTVRAAKKASSTVPIVMAVSADPVGTGLVHSLAQPKTNVTGMSLMLPDLTAKRFELLREIMPRMKRLGVLTDPGVPWLPRALEDLGRLARSSAVRLEVVGAQTPAELKSAFTTFGQRAVQAVSVLDSGLLAEQRTLVLQLAQDLRLPLIFGRRDWAEHGALFSYAADFNEMFRRAAGYVDKILRGAAPETLPIEQPTKFELVVNLKTAKSLDITIPQSMLVRADAVIK